MTLTLFGALIAMSVASSTREQRDEASKRIARYNLPLAIATIAIWAVLLAPW